MNAPKRSDWLKLFNGTPTKGSTEFTPDEPVLVDFVSGAGTGSGDAKKSIVEEPATDDAGPAANRSAFGCKIFHNKTSK